MIHSYPSRSYRDPESLEDVWIKIPVRYCALAKALGWQYTKRLLPDFLIPASRMRLDKVIEADRRKESESTLEECCRIIGCIDLRTAQMHMERLEEAAKAATLTLAEMQAAERKVSAEAAGYFASLRQRQAELDRQNAAVNYHKLKAEGRQ